MNRIKPKVFFVILALAALGVGYGIRTYYQKTSVTVPDFPTVPVKEGEFLVAINDTGVLKAKRSSLIIVPQMQRTWGEMKISKLVPEGSKVKKGDPVCWMDMTELEKNLKNFEFQMKIEENNLNNSLEAIRLQKENQTRQMKEKKLDWDLAKLQFELEKKKYDKIKRLVAEEILPQKDLDDEQYIYRSASLKVDQAEKEYLKAAEENTSNELMKEYDIERTKFRSTWSQKQYAEISESLSQAVLRTNEEGIVVYQKEWHGRTMTTIKEGDMIHSGHAVALIPDLREIQVMTQVVENDVSKIEMGMPVRIKLDSIPDLSMEGTVTQIGNLAMERERSQGSGQVSTEESAGIKVFEITVDLDTTDPRLRPGMTCKVDMILDSIPKAIYIPLNAIQIEEGKKFVYVQNKKDKSMEKRFVELGRQNQKEIIVLKGLQAGETLYLPEE